MYTYWSVDDGGFHFASSNASLASGARALLVDYLTQSCTTDSDLFSAELIFGEMLGNVVQHAPGPVRINVRRRFEHAVLEVCDEAEGYVINPTLPTDMTESSRGMFIVASLGEDLRVFRRGNETITSVRLPVRYLPTTVTALPSAAESLDKSINFDVRVQVDSLLALTSLRYPRIVAHMEDVAILSKRIAQALDLPSEVVLRTHLAARLHDIGLNGSDEDALCSAAPLSARERTQVEKHSIAASAVLAASPLLSGLSHIVRSHHERMDGKGYPDGLSGYEIPIESRIIAVADAFLTMTVEQPYRSPILPAHAFRELMLSRDQQLDGNIVNVCALILGYQEMQSERA